MAKKRELKPVLEAELRSDRVRHARRGKREKRHVRHTDVKEFMNANDREELGTVEAASADDGPRAGGE